MISNSTSYDGPMVLATGRSTPTRGGCPGGRRLREGVTPRLRLASNGAGCFKRRPSTSPRGDGFEALFCRLTGSLNAASNVCSLSGMFPAGPNERPKAANGLNIQNRKRRSRTHKTAIVQRKVTVREKDLLLRLPQVVRAFSHPRALRQASAARSCF